MPWQSGACVHHGNSAGKARAGIRWDRCIVIMEKGKGVGEGCQKRLKDFESKEPAVFICTEMSHFPSVARKARGKGFFWCIYFLSNESEDSKAGEMVQFYFGLQVITIVLREKLWVWRLFS